MFDSDKQKKANKKTYKISTDANSFPSLYVETGWESSSYGSSTVVWMAHRPAKEFHVGMEAKKNQLMSANRDPHLRSTHGGTGKSDARRLRFQRAAEGRGGVGGNHLATTAGKSAVSHFQLTLTLSVFLSVPASLFLCPKSAVHFPLSSPVKQLPLCAIGFYIFCCYFITRQNGR